MKLSCYRGQLFRPVSPPGSGNVLPDTDDLCSHFVFDFYNSYIKSFCLCFSLMQLLHPWHLSLLNHLNFRPHAKRIPLQTCSLAPQSLSVDSVYDMKTASVIRLLWRHQSFPCFFRIQFWFCDLHQKYLPDWIYTLMRAIKWYQRICFVKIEREWPSTVKTEDQYPFTIWYRLMLT